ncbi:uncharacterized protein BO66DRAFT_96190 [Aspergillus aculeatinus CBS 121060]|uniref:Uncharacterized protein n=1 Tax=Aspergillus aculeatinus CBS 121060 TaxID=1448322 RepID=A0ACD1H8N9_9EURO|nr:hypothetical protein BO66DRAFT_96190 [Aspergillus aculeatinus CBS 121060]RAH69773.1 hypothetical protein BO66DRAFT_96190 [Aspergillus aculeatinus CBS 121060]
MHWPDAGHAPADDRKGKGQREPAPGHENPDARPRKTTPDTLDEEKHDCFLTPETKSRHTDQRGISRRCLWGKAY